MNPRMYMLFLFSILSYYEMLAQDITFNSIEHLQGYHSSILRTENLIFTDSCIRENKIKDVIVTVHRPEWISFGYLRNYSRKGEFKAGKLTISMPANNGTAKKKRFRIEPSSVFSYESLNGKDTVLLFNDYKQHIQHNNSDSCIFFNNTYTKPIIGNPLAQKVLHFNDKGLIIKELSVFINGSYKITQNLYRKDKKLDKFTVEYGYDNCSDKMHENNLKRFECFSFNYDNAGLLNNIIISDGSGQRIGLINYEYKLRR